MHADGPLLHAVILKNTCVPGPEERCGMKAKGGRFLSFPREFAASESLSLTQQSAKSHLPVLHPYVTPRIPASVIPVWIWAISSADFLVIWAAVIVQIRFWSCWTSVCVIVLVFSPLDKAEQCWNPMVWVFESLVCVCVCLAKHESVYVLWKL